MKQRYFLAPERARYNLARRHRYLIAMAIIVLFGLLMLALFFLWPSASR